MAFQKENEKMTLVHLGNRLILNYKTMRHQGYKMHWRFLRCCIWMIRGNTDFLHSLWHYIHDIPEKTRTMKRSEIVRCWRKFTEVNTTQSCSVKWKPIIRIWEWLLCNTSKLVKTYRFYTEGKLDSNNELHGIKTYLCEFIVYNKGITPTVGCR